MTCLFERNNKTT